jgi:hypothetical protein
MAWSRQRGDKFVRYWALNVEARTGGAKLGAICWPFNYCHVSLLSCYFFPPLKSAALRLGNLRVYDLSYCHSRSGEIAASPPSSIFYLASPQMTKKQSAAISLAVVAWGGLVGTFLGQNLVTPSSDRPSTRLNKSALRLPDRDGSVPEGTALSLSAQSSTRTR